MLQQQIRSDMEAAMKARERVKLDTLRMLISAMTNEMKSSGHALVDVMPDDEVVAIIRREVRKRKEAAEAYTAAKRPELAQKEMDESAVLQAYLPELMSEDEVRKVVMKKKEDLGVTDKKDVGMLMGRVMKELQGKANGTVVKAVVDSLF